MTEAVVFALKAMMVASLCVAAVVRARGPNPERSYFVGPVEFVVSAEVPWLMAGLIFGLLIFAAKAA